MTSIQFTEADRDERGFVKAPEPRRLSDLLPQTAPPAPARQPLTRQELISAALVVPLLIGLLLYLSSGRTAAPAIPAPVPTAAPTVPTAASLPTAPPVAMLPAFAAPDGAQLGPIEATREMIPIAHYGADWIQAQVAGSGLVWLRASDVPALAIVGTDLAPHRPVAAPRAPVAVEPPPPSPVPPQCAEAGVLGQMVSVCGYDDLGVLEAQAKAQWLATYGGNIGTVGHPTPQIKDTQ